MLRAVAGADSPACTWSTVTMAVSTRPPPESLKSTWTANERVESSVLRTVTSARTRPSEPVTGVPMRTSPLTSMPSWMSSRRRPASAVADSTASEAPEAMDPTADSALLAASEGL